STASPNSISQALKQLSQDLQAGNLSGAQSDIAALRQDFQQNATQGSRGHHPHHHHHVQDSSQGSSPNCPGAEIDQAFGQIGQALQSGNLLSAKQAYGSVQQDFQQFAALGSGSTSASSSSSPASQGTVNV